MEQAAIIALSTTFEGEPGGSTLGTGSGTTNDTTSSSSASLLRRLPDIYDKYTQYLLCVQHVFLPLDRTHLWLPETNDVLVLRTVAATNATATTLSEVNTTPSTSAGTTTTTTTDTSSTKSSISPLPVQQDQQNIWQLGLAIFGKRLRELQWETRLYEEWLHALLYDWNQGDTLSSLSSSPSFTASHYHFHQYPVEENSFRRRQDLQSVWYFWQDLGWWSVLPLAKDLEEYWRDVSRKWTNGTHPSSSSSLSTVSSAGTTVAAKLIEFMHAKHVHVHQWPWLPTTWLHAILEHCLIAPHLRESLQDSIIDSTQNKTNLNFLTKKSNTNTTMQNHRSLSSSLVDHNTESTTPILLLAQDNLDPILKIAISSTGTNRDSASQVVYKLWVLATRLPAGQLRVAKAIARFAKRESIACIIPPEQQGNNSIDTGGGGAPSASSSTSNSNNMIADLLDLQLTLSRLLSILPNANDIVPLKQVWEEAVNVQPPSGQPSVAESLAKFLDSILKSNKKMDQYQRESDQWLNRIISGIFVPLQAKDIFEAFYKKDLAKRLLWNRVVSMDVEKQVCSLLKAECGNAYTSKIEGMFQDVEFSRETMMVYKQSQQPTESGDGGTSSLSTTAPPVSNDDGSVEMEVQVLTTGYWPVYPQYPTLSLPDSLKRPQEHFDNHYKSKYQGRRMTWQYALGHCVVRCSGFPKVYDLVVSLCQALVLTQFTTSSRHTILDLMRRTGLEDKEEMERILQSLSLAKEGTRILRKLDYDADPQKKRKIRQNVDDKDIFIINESFESNQRRIRINNIMAKETKEERDKTVEGVSRDRLYLIDAVLVRIMKARKTILHQSLIPQTLEQIKVPAQPADVKKRIESLIEREYMERDPKDRNRYNYLA
jgi:cullin-4